MACLYPTALLAFCNAKHLTINCNCAFDRFKVSLYEWMYKTYINNDKHPDIVDRGFIVEWPSQPNMLHWFNGIRKIMNFTRNRQVISWFACKPSDDNEHEIDLVFNMLKIIDQKNFIKSYSTYEDNCICNSTANEEMRGYDLAFQPDADLRSIIPVIEQSGEEKEEDEDEDEEELHFSDYTTEEERPIEEEELDERALRAAFPTPHVYIRASPLLTVRGRRIARISGFDEFVESLSHEINGTRDIVSDNDGDDDSDGMPDLISVDSRFNWLGGDEVFSSSDSDDEESDDDLDVQPDGSINV